MTSIAIPSALAIACALALTPACGKSSSASESKPIAVEIAKLGLHADVPAGSTVGDGVVGEGVMIQGPNLVVSVELASDSRPKTADDAKQDADMYTPKNLATEKLADGWVLTFDNEGSMGKNYFAEVRRDIAGKAYWCETTASNPQQQQNAVAACKSLRP